MRVAAVETRVSAVGIRDETAAIAGGSLPLERMADIAAAVELETLDARDGREGRGGRHVDDEQWDEARRGGDRGSGGCAGRGGCDNGGGSDYIGPGCRARGDVDGVPSRVGNLERLCGCGEGIPRWNGGGTGGKRVEAVAGEAVGCYRGLG